MLQRETVLDSTYDLIQELQEKSYLKDFILVGGTSLALQYGHRISVDIDLFSTGDFNTARMQEYLESDFGFQSRFDEKNTLNGIIRGVKVDVLSHKYPLLKQPIVHDGIRLASQDDIAAMKLNAISIDGTRVKDFIDMNYILDRMTLKSAIMCFENKYNLRNSFHAVRSLNYFEEVDLSDWPAMKDKSVTWDKIKKRLDKEVATYSRNFLNSPRKGNDLNNDQGINL